MKRKIYYFTALTLILGTFLPLFGFKIHPFHVSSTEILYGKESTLEISTRIFTDDFESILSKLYKTKIDLSNPKTHQQMDVWVEKYIQEVLQLYIDQKKLNIHYLGYEINKEATQIYLESEKIKTPKNILIKNKILFQLFDDQNNIVHIIVNGKRKSEQMQFPNTTLEQKF